MASESESNGDSAKKQGKPIVKAVACIEFVYTCPNCGTKDGQYEEISEPDIECSACGFEFKVVE